MNADNVRTLIQNADEYNDTYLGSRKSQLGIEEQLGVPDHNRFLNTLIIGPIGHGKTQQMIHTALQDAKKGYGLTFLNPKGDAITQLLAKLPADRHSDIIYINPDQQRCPAINILQPYTSSAMTKSERQLQHDLIINDLMSMFRRVTETWGDRWPKNLKTLLRAHLQMNDRLNTNTTLYDVFECIVDDEKLTDLIDHTRGSVLRQQLISFKNLSRKEREPLLLRFIDFLQNETIRSFITQPESSIDFRDALQQNKIILVDVQKGTLGAANAAFLGSIIMTKIWAAAQSRITLPMAQRTPHFLYVDETHTFTGESAMFTSILSESREYRLSCNLASQYLGQLPGELREALTNNCRTKIFFNPGGSEDLAALTEMLNGLSREQLTRLGKYRAAVQLPATEQYTPAKTIDTYPPWETDRETAEELKTELSADYPVLRDRQQRPAVIPGQGGNAGKETHSELLQAAQQYFADEQTQVNILHQDIGADRPDGHLLHADGTVDHIEAECNTLSKPAKVLTNLQRAYSQDRACVFVVEAGNGAKLANILEDPVNRRVSAETADGEDGTGPYSYYTADGQPFTETDIVEETAYTIYEARDDELHEYTQGDDAPAQQCPEIVEDNANREELETFCLYRDPDDNYCEKLGAPCVVSGDE